jgi:hypothetical protein
VNKVNSFASTEAVEVVEAVVSPLNALCSFSYLTQRPEEQQKRDCGVAKATFEASTSTLRAIHESQNPKNE